MKCRCSTCQALFEIEPAIKGNHKWMSDAIYRASIKHSEISPGCQYPYLHVTMDERPIGL